MLIKLFTYQITVINTVIFLYSERVLSMNQDNKDKLIQFKNDMPKSKKTYKEQLDNNWNIYIDESYYENNGKIVTAFYAINNQRRKAAFKNYRDQIMSLNPNVEIKSAYVSDQVNIQAVKASKGFRAIYQFCTANNNIIHDNSNIRKSLTFVYLIETYISPIDQLIKEIKQKYPAPVINIMINIDSRPLMEPNSNFAKCVPYYLNYLSNKNSNDQIDIRLNWQTLDSATSVGIQIADMRCGAYRKQKTYQDTDPNINMLPISYLEINYSNDYHYDSLFLSIYGMLSIINQNDISKAPKLITISHLSDILDKFRNYMDYLQKQSSPIQIQALNVLKTNYDKMFKLCPNRTKTNHITSLSNPLADLGKYRTLAVNFSPEEDAKAVKNFNDIWQKMPKYQEFINTITN